LLTVVQTLKEYGKQAVGLNEQAVIQTSEDLRNERDHYEYFESQFKGFSPTVQIHKLPGGAMGSSFEQAVKGGFLNKMPTILHDELPKVQIDLGNFWSVTPGSQIIWTTAVSNVQGGDRYGNPSGDLKNLLLGKYGPFPFYRPADWIYEKVFGPTWQEILEKEGGMEAVGDIDIDQERRTLTERLGVKPTEQQLVIYFQHPNDAVNFYKFEEKFGRVYVLPPSILFRRHGFKLGESLKFKDHNGKEHFIEIGPEQKNESGETNIYLNIDHHQRVFLFKPEVKGTAGAGPVQLSKEEIVQLAKGGDARALFTANVCEVSVKVGQVVQPGDRLVILEAMKMQTPVTSEVGGKVQTVSVKVGQSVKPGDKLVKIAVEA